MSDPHTTGRRQDVQNVRWRNSTDTWYSSLSETENSMSDEEEVIFELDEKAMAELPPHLQKNMRDIQQERFRRLSRENPDIEVRKQHNPVQQTVEYHHHYPLMPEPLAERSNLDRGHMDQMAHATMQSTTTIPPIAGPTGSNYLHTVMERQNQAAMQGPFYGHPYKKIRGASVGEYRKTPIGLEPRALQLTPGFSGNKRSANLPSVFRSGAEKRPHRRENTQNSLFRGSTSLVSSVRGRVRRSLQRISGVFQRN